MPVPGIKKVAVDPKPDDSSSRNVGSAGIRLSVVTSSAPFHWPADSLPSLDAIPNNPAPVLIAPEAKSSKPRSRRFDLAPISSRSRFPAPGPRPDSNCAIAAALPPGTTAVDGLILWICARSDWVHQGGHGILRYVCRAHDPVE